MVSFEALTLLALLGGIMFYMVTKAIEQSARETRRSFRHGRL